MLEAMHRQAMAKSTKSMLNWNPIRMIGEMMPTAQKRKNKFTASVSANLVRLLDQRAAQLKVNRSTAVETAIELWLRKQCESEEEEYFARTAKEMNEDARDWNAISTASSMRTWNK